MGIYITGFISRGLSRIAVPMFFFISGYYAFYKKDWRQKSIWILEIKKRLKSLFFPYILWISISIILNLIKAQTGLDIRLGATESFRITSLSQFFSYYWGIIYLYPLWYIRDLMVLCVLGPILYRLLSWSKGYILLPLLVCFLSGWRSGVAGFDILPFFCFMLGGLNKIDPLEKIQRFRYLAGVITLCLLLVLPVLYQG